MTEPMASTVPFERPSPAAPKSAARVHLVGVCGSGMKSLAELLVDRGVAVSGTDRQAATPGMQSLIDQGLQFHSPEAAGRLQDASQLVYSIAVPESHADRAAARERGIPEFSYPQYVAHLLADRRQFCVAGTHGKSTTSAMLASILYDAGWNPSAIFGAELIETERGGWNGQGDWAVLESCEYRKSFLEYAPQSAILQSVEPDHFDCFATEDELCEAFTQFSQRVAADGVLLVRGESAAAVRAASGSPARCVTFGLRSEFDWWADDVRRTSAGMRFRLFHRGDYANEISLEVPGRHNVTNALAAAAAAHELGVSARAVRESLVAFQGIRRRFEVLGSWRGITLVDDYAHHPTAIRETLRTARELYGSRRIWCAFQPHQISRTEMLMDDFAASFADADELLLAPIVAARETDGERAGGVLRALSERTARADVAVRICESLDRVARTLQDEARPGDVLLTLGAGDIDRVHYELTRRIFRNSAARRAAGPVHMAEGGRPRSILPHSA